MKWSLVKKRVSDLREWPKNPRKITEKGVRDLTKSIRKFGLAEPIVINTDNTICGGHGRRKVLLQEGMESVDCYVPERALTEKEFEELNIRLNKNIAGVFDFDILANEFEMSDLLEWGFELDELDGCEFDTEKLDPQCDEDNVPDAPPEPTTKRGDVWILGRHRLMCGDSTMIDDVERLMNGEKADLWIADPPFGVSYCDKNSAIHGGTVLNQNGKEIKGDTKSVKDLCIFWRDVASNAYSVTTMEASNYWCACQGSDKMMMMMMMMMDEAGWNIRHELIWVKDSFVFGRSDYHYRHEPIIYGWKKDGKHNWFSDRKQDSVFEIPRPRKSDLHPTTKPVELFEQFFNNSCPSGGLVFESFGGSGTSIIASEKTGKRCNTMELDERYCDVIINRWEQYTGKDAILESTKQKYKDLNKNK